MTFMMMGLFWLLAAKAFFGPSHHLIYLFFAVIPLGSFAVLPTALTAGLTFTGAPIVSLLFIARIMLTNKNGIDALIDVSLDPRKQGVLFYFWLVAVFSTAFMPRLFAGEVLVVPIRGELDQTSLLYPTMQNVSQLFYVSISVFFALVLTIYLKNEKLKRYAIKGFYVGAFVAIVTGLLDFLSSYIPISWLLEIFRNASYAVIPEVQVLGLKRTVGLMPEASAYGGICIAFLGAIYYYGNNPKFNIVSQHAHFATVALLILLAILSTSSGALLGLVLFALVAILYWLQKIINARNAGVAGELSKILWVLYFCIAFVVVLGIIAPWIFEPIIALFDRMLFQKASSDSFEERGMWRAVAFDAVWQTFGLGVGVGGTRSSSTMVAILSNTGVIGAMLFYTYLIQNCFRRTTNRDQLSKHILQSFKWAVAPSIALSSVVGGVNFGSILAFQFGLVGASVLTLRQKTRKVHSAAV